MFDTVLVAGLGLMGGSMAKTIKARTLNLHLTFPSIGS